MLTEVTHTQKKTILRNEYNVFTLEKLLQRMCGHPPAISWQSQTTQRVGNYNSVSFLN